MLHQALDIDDYVGDPFGRYFVSTSFMSWCMSPTLCGTIVGGYLDEAEMRCMVRVIDFALHPKMQPYRVLVDLRRFRLVDPTPFIILDAYTRERRAYLEKMIVTQAIVLPTDRFSSFVAAGYFEALGMQARCHAAPEAALAQVGESSALLQALDELWLTAGNQARLAAIRATIRGALADARAPQIATALGMSVRAMQRILLESGSTFSDELLSARLSAAEKLLKGTDWKIAAIAQMIGYASASHFTKVFKAARGVTPEGWRARLRH